MDIWQAEKLENITVKIGDGLHSTPIYTSASDFWFINGNNIRNSKVVISSSTKMVNMSEYLKYRIDINASTILMSINGTIGNLAYYNSEKIILGKSVAYINCSSAVLREYLFAFLSSKYIYDYFHNEITGSTIKNLSLGTIRNIPISLPSIHEQERIVSVLETWDNYLELLDKKIALKEQLKKGLMQHLLTGEVRLPGFTDPWQEYKLGEVINVSKGKALSSNGLSSGDIPVIAGGKTSPYSHSGYTHENVITVSASGAYAGYIAYHPYKIWASDCSVVFGKDGRSATEYIYQFLKYNQHKIYTLQSGGAQPHIYPADLKIIKINLPSINEQQAIAGIISTAELEIKKLNEYKKMIESQKKYLVSNLITGKIRTPQGLKIPSKEVQYA